MSYESYVALREPGAVAVVPITPVSFESYVALREGAALGAFATLYEADSGLSMGARHTDRDFDVGIRYVGASDMTLEEFEASLDAFATLYEADSGLSMGARHTDRDFDVGIRYVGVSDKTLEEFELLE